MKRICKQCGVEFEISDSEIEFYKNKNLSLPKRCKQCRNKNKQINSPYITNNNNTQSQGGYYNPNNNNTQNQGGYYNPNNNTQNQRSYYYSNNNNTQNRRGYYNPNTVRQKKRRKPVRSWLACSLVAVFLLLCIISVYVKGLGLIEFFEKNTAVTYTESSQYHSTQGNSSKPSKNNQYNDSSSSKVSENKPYNDSSSEVNENEQYNEKHYTFRKDEYLQEHYWKHGIAMGFNSAQDYLDAANTVINNPNSLHKLEKEDGDDVYFLESTNEFVIVSPVGYVRTYFIPDDGIDYFNRQ